MIFKSALLNPTGWENNYSLKVLKLQQKGGKFAFKLLFRGFDPSYGAQTKFKRNTGLYGTSDVDKSS